VPAECAITERPLTIADLPELLPAVLQPVYDQVLPCVLGGDPVVLPEQMPGGLPATAARELAAALAPQRPARTGRAAPVTGPARAGDPVVFDEAGVARLRGFLAQIADRRALRGRRYPLAYLLALHWLRDVVLGEDDSRLSIAARAMTALRNLVIGLCRLTGITRISHQLRHNSRDPYRRPLVLLGLAKPIRDQPDTERDRKPQAAQASLPEQSRQPARTTARHELRRRPVAAALVPPPHRPRPYHMTALRDQHIARNSSMWTWVW